MNNWPTKVLPLILIFVFILPQSACKSRQSGEQSMTKDILLESDRVFADDGRRTVFIYLVNNTQIMDISDDSSGGFIPRRIERDENINIKNWQNFGDPIWKKLVLLKTKLKENSKSQNKLKYVVETMTEDALNFHKVVAMESKIIRVPPSSRDLNSGNGDLITVTFSNSAHIIHNEHIQKDGEDGPMLIVDGSRASLVQPALNIASYINDPRLKLHPIADMGGLTRIFEVIRQELPPSQFKYILIIKSHGSSDLLLTTKFNLDISQLTDSELISLIDKTNDSIEDEQTKTINQQKSGLAPEDILVQSFPTKLSENIDAQHLRSKAPKIGLSKAQFVNFMNDQGSRYGMFFPIVVLESCNSRLSTNTNLKGTNLKAIDPLSSVGALYTSDEKGLSYTNFDYDEFFTKQALANSKDFVRNFKNYLDQVSER